MAIFKTGGIAAILTCAITLSLPLGYAKAQAVGPAVTTTLNPRGAWSSSASYVANDLVTLRNSSWRALRASKGKLPGQTSPSTAADWALFAGGLNPIGSWKSTATFQRNDLVFSNFATWRALRTSLNVTPGTSAADWLIFAARGATGATGPRGLQGLQGPAGPNTTANGSVTAPVINFSSSPDTGIFSPGGGKLALAENGKLFLHDIGDLNTALGLGALANVTDGSSDTAVGFNALMADTTGFGNTGVGESALRNTNDGFLNTAVGNFALFSNIGGSSNVAVGSSALRNNTTGIDNTAVGRNALFANIGGGSNTAVGRSALSANTGGVSNTAVGFQALQSNVGGIFNAAVGSGALLNNSTGFSNTAMGIEALKANTDGTNNTAIGAFALQNKLTGDGNTAVGEGALMNATGDGNVAIGTDAGGDATNPSQSIFIRNPGTSGDTLTIKIGSGAQTSAFIGGIRGVTTGVADAVPVLIDSHRQLGTISSSRRYKQDIHSMGAMSDMLARLRPVSFRYIKPYADGSKPIHYGLIAEEVAEVFPYLSVFNAGGQPETVKYHELATFLLEGFQEQQRTIAAQAEEIARQQAINDAQAERMAALEQRLLSIEAQLDQPRITTASDSR